MKSAALVLLSLVSISSAQWVNLWPGDAPGAKRPPAGSETHNGSGHLGNIEVPQYEVYLPDKTKANGAAAIILPGGGYSILAAGHEGKEYAEWLNQRGIAGIVVKYRVSGDAKFGYQFPVPFLDARRAIRTVRAKAAEWNIDPHKVGVMGSSAGGHLASLCATRFADTFPEETADEIDKLDCRPDFAVLAYPVISMENGIGHGGSRNNLLGANPTADAVKKYSTEQAVSDKTPPCFLVTTADDGVDCRNSLRFAEACREHHIPAELHMFETGGHGYGLHGQGALSTWPDLLGKWLDRRYPPVR